MNFMIIVMILMGIVFMAVGAILFRDAADVKKRGKHVTATLTDVTVSEQLVRRGKRRVRANVYSCKMEYMAGDEMQSVKYETSTRELVSGEKMVITYLPEDPQRYYTGEEQPFFSSALIFGLGVFVVVYGVKIAFF